jgi:hypothetical protein
LIPKPTSRQWLPLDTRNGYGNGLRGPTDLKSVIGLTQTDRHLETLK